MTGETEMEVEKDLSSLAKVGVAVIKAEFLKKVEDAEPMDTGKPDPVKDEAQVAADKARKAARRGQDRKREKKMAHAMADVRQNSMRLCPSMLIPGRECRFGAKCNASHDIKDYVAKKEEDIRPSCIIYDQLGKCNFGVSCRFAKAHTNPDTFEQLEKQAQEAYQPTLNADGVKLQKLMRKHEYDFKKSDDALVLYRELKKQEIATGAMEREKLKMNMRDLKGKKYLAPLTTVGNLPFRRLCVEMGADITCGEMAVATSLLQGNPSEWSLIKRHPSEKIFGVQLAGGFPDTMAKAAQILTENMQLDFIDINLGCPIDAVNDKGGGCALFNRSNKLMEVVHCMQSVMKDTPLSVKMRYGLKEGDRIAHKVIRRLVNEYPPQLLTIHPRSKEQRYTKAAEWDYIPECIEAANGKVPVWVSGDCYNYEDYYANLENYAVDGIMVGRGALIKPWLFTEIDEKRHYDISATERLDLIKKFCNYGLEHWGTDDAGIQTTRRFLLEWLSFQHRYVPTGILEYLPPKINQKPLPYYGRCEMESLLASRASSDWLKISEMFLGKTPQGYLFVPKHKANAY
ncbi:unnamed protein product [Bursaphelenchus okinawaensis]|uniref:tRNA-dihydrouridine(47) synthase [NAD(P)(+)] n=1 Tax=Bursaphelenchus okinawaensis TaxID=465554 RepID=A0A811LNP4_9BILA|nr:unnamed protein product [Bursaphelenchus okinawaensis]CAG9127317.1 unnamed protein product [Bursaphelenchus okinawaensis]